MTIFFHFLSFLILFGFTVQENILYRTAKCGIYSIYIFGNSCDSNPSMLSYLFWFILLTRVLSLTLNLGLWFYNSSHTLWGIHTSCVFMSDPFYPFLENICIMYSPWSHSSLYSVKLEWGLKKNIIAKKITNAFSLWYSRDTSCNNSFERFVFLNWTYGEYFLKINASCF